MKDLRAQISSIEIKTEQNASAICGLRDMLDVFANLLIPAVDREMDRKIEERLGGCSSPSTDSSRSD